MAPIFPLRMTKKKFNCSTTNVSISGCAGCTCRMATSVSAAGIKQTSYLFHSAVMFRFLATHREANDDSHAAPPTWHVLDGFRKQLEHAPVRLSDRYEER